MTEGELEQMIDEILERHTTYMNRLENIKRRIAAVKQPDTILDYIDGYDRFANLLEELGEVVTLLGGVQCEIADAVMKYTRDRD